MSLSNFIEGGINITTESYKMLIQLLEYECDKYNKQEQKRGIIVLSDKEKQAIEYLKECIMKENLFEEDFTLYQIKIILNIIMKLQKENEKLEETIDNSAEEQKEREKYTHSLEIKLQEKDRIIKEFENECRKFKAFCKRVRKEKQDVDLFNQGQEYKSNQFLNLISGEKNWDYEGKYFNETNYQIENKGEIK